jgi:hypothetical protein
VRESEDRERLLPEETTLLLARPFGLPLVPLPPPQRGRDLLVRALAVGLGALVGHGYQQLYTPSPPLRFLLHLGSLVVDSLGVLVKASAQGLWGGHPPWPDRHWDLPVTCGLLAWGVVELLVRLLPSWLRGRRPWLALGGALLVLGVVGAVGAFPTPSGPSAPADPLLQRATPAVLSPAASTPSPSADRAGAALQRVTPAVLPPAPTPTAGPTVPPSIWVVANTDGQGVYLRRQPALAAITRAYPEGTMLTDLGQEAVAEGLLWRRVRAPDGQEGWVPQRYLAPATPGGR